MAFAFNKTTPVTAAIAMFELKTLLKAQGWTVPSSGDGTTYFSASDGITTGAAGAGGLNNLNAWFRIQDPAGIVEFVFQRCSSSTLWRIKWSRTSKFIIGSPSATRVPAAADEDIPWSGGTDASPTGSTLWTTDGTYRWNCAADNAAPYGWWSGAFLNGGGIAQTALVYDPVTPSDATDSYKYVLYVASTPTGASTFSFTGMGGEAGTTATQIIYGHVPSVGVGAAAAYQAASLNSTSGQVVPNNLGGNPISGKDEIFPICLVRRSAQITPGFKGISTLMKWHGTNRANGDTLTISTARDRIVYKDVNLPWDGSVPVV